VLGSIRAGHQALGLDLASPVAMAHAEELPAGPEQGDITFREVPARSDVAPVDHSHRLPRFEVHVGQRLDQGLRTPEKGAPTFEPKGLKLLERRSRFDPKRAYGGSTKA
jgi:hypothetical protein